jgi:hypothetical protein
MARSDMAGALVQKLRRFATGERKRTEKRLGGESPLRALMTGTVSRTARVSTARWNLKEAVRKLPARGTRTACEASGRWARRHKSSNPTVIRSKRAYMQRVYGRKVSRLTLGDLLFCHWLGASRGVPMKQQKSAEVVVPACALRRRTEQTSSGQSNHSRIKVGEGSSLRCGGQS